MFKKLCSQEVLVQCFWFLILTSWIPIIASYLVFPGLELSKEYHFTILIPEPIKFNNSWICVNFIFFALSVGIGFYLKSYLKDYKTPYYLTSLSLLFSGFIPYFNGLHSLTPTQAIFYTLYLASFIVSFYNYLKYSSIFSTAFGVFCVLLFIDSFIPYFIWVLNLVGIISIEQKEILLIDNHSIFGMFYDLYSIGFIKTLLFILSFVLVRILYKAWADNKEFFNNLNTREKWTYFINTLKLWYPVLGFFLLCTLFFQYCLNPWIASYTLEKLNTNTIINTLSEDKRPENLELAFLTINQLSIDKQIKDTKTYIKNLTKAVDQSPQGIHDQLDKDLPNTIFKKKECGWDPVLCPIVNATKSLGNKIYLSSKRKKLRSIKYELQELADGSNKLSKSMQDVIVLKLKQLKNITTTAINSLFNLWSLFSFLMFLYGIIILIKTFLMVCSRVCFSPETENTATFKTQSFENKTGKITRLKDKFVLKPSDKNTFYFCRNSITVSGAPPARKTPQMFTALLQRIWHKRWGLNYVDPSSTSDGVTITVAKPSEFVMWNIAKGEKVYFHFADFVGMSSEAKIKRHISLSVSTLLFGRIVYHYIEGPGLLFLKTKAQPTVSPEKEALSGQNSALLVAWNNDVNFKINASHTVVDTLFSDYHIKPNQENELIVMDLSEERGTSTAAGVSRFLKSFVFPV